MPALHFIFQGNSKIYFPANKDKSSGSNDYVNTGVLHLDNAQNYTVDPSLSFTRNKGEARWDYYREDPLLHVFHSLLHKEMLKITSKNVHFCQQF